MVTAAYERGVQFYEGEKQLTKGVNEFTDVWSGVVLLAEKNESSGEKNYSVSRRREQLHSQRLPALFAAAFLLMSVSAVSFYHHHTLLTSVGYSAGLVLALAGVGITSLLLWYEIDRANPALQKICSAGAKTNCNAILGSRQSKVFAGLSWSEVGFFYFGVSLISLLLACINTSSNLLTLVVWLNVLALPYTVFSLYYQGMVAKQWCPLCVGVQALLLLQFGVAAATGLLSSSFTVLPNATDFLFFLFLTAALVAAWYGIKPLLLKSEEAKRTKRELIRLKANPQIFESLLSKQKPMLYSTDGLGIIIGNPTATNTLVKVCNPYCGPCAKAHPQIEKLVEENENLKVQIIFTATNEEGDTKALPVKHLLAVAEMGNEKATQQALDDWYLSPKKDYNLFAGKYPMNGELKKQGGKVEAMHAWCRETGIQFTPTLFFNGYQLPEIYNLSDIQYFLQ